MSTAAQREPLVDTDVWIDYLRGNPQAIRFVKALPDTVWISAVSVAELHVGVREGEEREALAGLLSTLSIASVDEAVAARGGLMRRDLGRTQGVGLNDALIAATALELGLKLYTLNVKHFAALPKAQLAQPYKKS